MEQKKFRMYFTVAIIILLVILLVTAAFSFIQGFLGALIMYVFFSPAYRFLVKKKVNKKLAAILVILASIFIILLPFIMLLTLAAINAKDFINLWIQNPQMISDLLASVDSLIAKVLPSFNLFSFLGSHISGILGVVQSLIVKTISGVGLLIVNAVIMYASFYYMMTEEESFKKMKEILPFSSKNSEELIKKFKEATYTTILVSGIIAVMQGFILGLAFFIFGINSWLFWGFVTAVLAFIPFVGQWMVWIPAAIIMLAYGDYTAAIGILVAGIILSNIDNVIRPYLQSRMGNIHPLVTLIGVFIGIPLFGIFGIIIGPLIISYVFLTLKMFKEEHLR